MLMGVMHNSCGYAYSANAKSASVPYALICLNELLGQNGSPGHVIMWFVRKFLERL